MNEIEDNKRKKVSYIKIIAYSFLIIFLLIVSLLILGVNEFPNVEASTGSNTLPQTAEAEFLTFDIVSTTLDSKRERKVEALRKEQLKHELQARTDNLEALLRRYNSPFTGLGYIIVQRAHECGGDYKLLAAIAGNESGFGRIPYKRYNPFGYLDGVQYSSWEEALYILSCRISQQHLAPCNNSPECVIIRYGGSDTNRPKWIQNIRWFMGQL